MKERNSLQLGFVEKNSYFVVPENVLDKDFGRQVASFLEKRNIWKQRPRGVGVLVEIGENVDISYFDTSNWQVLTPDKNFKKVSAVLAVCDNDGLDISVLPLDNMKKGAVFYVFERVDKRVPKEPRLQILSEIGVVEKSILNSSLSSFCVWEGRIEKPKKPRSPIDLLDKNKRPRSYSWARRLWEDMQEEYKRSGFIVVPDPEAPIVKRLQASKNPPDDFSRLKMGWGVEIKNPSCGCHAKVDLEGNVDWIYNCGQESHHNRR